MARGPKFFGQDRGAGPNLMQQAMSRLPQQPAFDMQALLGSGMLQSPAAAQFLQSVFGANKPQQPQPFAFPGGGSTPIALGVPGFGGFGGVVSGKGNMGQMPGWWGGMLGQHLDQMKPGPAPSPFLGLNKFMGPFGNGGGSLVPQFGGQGGGNKGFAQLPVFRGALF